MKTFDVAIIGGGIIGGSIAFELAQQKLRVAVFDRQQPGREASWAAAGMLSPAPDSPDAIPLVPLARASLELYPEFVAAVEEASGRSVGLRREGTLELLFARDASRELSTLIALHHGLGLPTEPLPFDEAYQLEPALGRDARAAAYLPYEGSVDNRALTEAALEAAVLRGATLYANMEVHAVTQAAKRVTGVRTRTEEIPAGHVILAAGCYSGQVEAAPPYAPMRPVRGQMVALESPRVRLGHVLRSERGYIVPRAAAGATQRFVAGSTLEDAGFAKGLTPAGLESILHAAIELVPDLASAAVVETWSGLRPDTPDHLPVLGPTDIEGFTIATGHYRNGILLAPITARLIREQVTEGTTSLPMESFSPLRFAAARHRTAR